MILFLNRPVFVLIARFRSVLTSTCLSSFYRMSLPCVRLCSRHMTSGLQVCGYATVSKSFRPREKSSGGPVFQYVGQHRKPNHKVFVWGFSFTGALGLPSFVVPDSGRKNPRKYQLTPYRLDTAQQVKHGSAGWSFFILCSWTTESGLVSIPVVSFDQFKTEVMCLFLFK